MYSYFQQISVLYIIQINLPVSQQNPLKVYLKCLVIVGFYLFMYSYFHTHLIDFLVEIKKEREREKREVGEEKILNN